MVGIIQIGSGVSLPVQHVENPFGVLISLTQTRLVKDYAEKIEQYARLLKGIDQDYLIGIFLIGLRDDIKAEVKLSDPSTLAELTTKAQIVEEKIKVTTQGGTPNGNTS